VTLQRMMDFCAQTLTARAIICRHGALSRTPWRTDLGCHQQYC